MTVPNITNMKTESPDSDEALKRIAAMEEKYFALVWYARSFPANDSAWNGTPKDIKDAALNAQFDVIQKYPEETRMLEKEPDWTHGFNSGMLACLRWVTTMRDSGIEEADGEFPFLDT